MRVTVLGRFRLALSRLRKLTPATTGSSVLGFLVGVLPGTGGDIGAFVAYSETRRFSRGDKQFGNGDPRGVAAAESANNASTAGALVPMLTLGIPGDSVSAILIGAITVHGLRPGPQLFTGSPDLRLRHLRRVLSGLRFPACARSCWHKALGPDDASAHPLSLADGSRAQRDRFLMHCARTRLTCW